MKPIWLSIFTLVLKVVAVLLLLLLFKVTSFSNMSSLKSNSLFSPAHRSHEQTRRGKKKKKDFRKHNSFEESLCLLQNYSNEKIFFFEVKRQLRSTSSVQIKKRERKRSVMKNLTPSSNFTSSMVI